MSLAFLAKKSWHTANLKNVEKVWIAEQQHAEEQKKMAELRKQIEEERQLQELRQLQAASGNKKAAQPRVDWMYDGPMAHTSSTEDYLLGKEYKAKDPVSELKETEAVPGALWTNEASSSVNDTFSRLNEDPMMMIKKRQQNAAKDILKNPVKMKRIKEKVEDELKQKKMSKKAKKEKKKRKSNKYPSVSPTRRRSPSPSPVRRRRSRSPARRSRRSPSPSPRRRRSRSPAVARRERRRSPSRSPRRRRSRSPVRRSRRSPSPVRRRRSRSPAVARREHRRSPSPKRSRHGKYGLSNVEKAEKCQVADSSSLGPNQKFLDSKRQAKEREREEKIKLEKTAKRVLTEEEKETMVREMMQDATAREDRLAVRSKKVDSNDELHEDRKKSASFISSLRSKAYMENDQDIGDRLRRNKYYVQSNSDSFMKRD